MDPLLLAELRKLEALDRDALWRAKLGAETAAEPAPLVAPPADAPAPPAPLAGPGDPDRLRADFALLLDAAAPAPDEVAARATPEDEAPPPRVRPRRLGESPVDRSALPGLAQPRRQELRDLETGRREADRRVDLHGCTVAEAVRRVRDELAAARDRGLQYLLLITGRGLRSEAGARIQPAVVDFLLHEGREHTLWFEAAPVRLGGGGALLVRVRRAGREGHGAEPA